MLYAVLCYHSEDVVTSWSAEQEQAVMGKLTVVQDKLAKAGRLGPVARLMPTTAASLPTGQSAASSCATVGHAARRRSSMRHGSAKVRA